MRRSGHLIAIALLFAMSCASSTTRLEPNPLGEPGRRWALMVTADKYADSRAPKGLWPRSGDGARRIAQQLQEKFGYAVLVLSDEDATKSEIDRYFEALRSSSSEGDSIFVYLALSTIDADRMVPYDGNLAIPWTLVSVSRLLNTLASISASSVLLASESCIPADSALLFEPQIVQQEVSDTGRSLEGSRWPEVLSVCEYSPSGTLGSLLLDALSKSAGAGTGVLASTIAKSAAGSGVRVRYHGPITRRDLPDRVPFGFAPVPSDPVQAARKGTAESRKAAIERLGRIAGSSPTGDRSADAVRVLVSIVSDRQEATDVRAAAISALGSARGSDAMNGLSSILSDPGHPTILQVLAVDSLERIADPAVLHPLHIAAASKERLVKLAGLRSLGRLKSKESLPFVLKMVGDPDTTGDAALAALAAIQQIDPRNPEAARAGVQVLEREVDDASLRRSVLGFLGALADPAAESAIVERLDDDPDPGVRRAAAAALGRLSDPPKRARTIERLGAALQSRDAVVRETASLSLGELRAVEMAGALEQALHHDPEARVRAAACTALVKVGRRDPGPFAAAARDVSADVRASVSAALGSICGAEAESLLLPLSFTDEDPTVRQAATTALGACRGGKPIANGKVLEWALSSTNADVKISALQRAAPATENEAIAALIRALDDTDYQVRDAATEALWKSPAAAAALEHAVVSGSTVRRVAAAIALGSVQGGAAVDALSGQAGTADKEVRLAVLRALGTSTDTRAIAATTAAAQAADEDVVIAATDALRAQSTALYAKEDYPAARSAGEVAMTARERVLGPSHLDLAIDLNNMGVFSLRLKDLEAAEQYCRRAISIRRERLGRSHSTVAVSMNNLALVLIARKRLDEAARVLEEAFAIRQSAVRPADHDYIQSLRNLATVYDLMDRSAQAAEYRGRADKLQAIPAKAGD